MTAAGHNAGTVSPEDMDVLWAIHTRKVREAKDAIKRAQDNLKDVLADVKNDKFDKKEIVDYVDLITSDDQKKHVDKFNMLRRNREKLGLIPPQSKDLFGDRATREQQIDTDGYECGLNGLDRVSRHTAGGTEDRIWLDAYDRGVAKYSERWEIVAAAMEAARQKEEAASSKEEPPVTSGDDPFKTDSDEE